MKELTKKQHEQLKKILEKIIIGVISGTKLTKEECKILVQYMNNRDEMIKDYINNICRRNK